MVKFKNVEALGQKIGPKTAFLIEHLDLSEATGVPDAEWETFQLAFLNGDHLFDISSKARQIGWSFVAALDAVAASILYPNTPHIFVSINKDEAKEKIRYAKLIIGALDKSVRPKRFPIENQTELELSNGSRLISHPCKPPRGKGRVTIYLDEFAHYPIADDIYAAAIPVTTRGGKVRIGSTPLGAQGMFWEIFDEKLKPYPGFNRRFLPWWVARGLCVDIRGARQFAKSMNTDERVHAFGTVRLINIFENMPLEDFQQEYECMWMDESQSWITWSEIKQNQMWAVDDALHYEQVKITQSNDFTDLFVALDKLKKFQQDGRLERELTVGVDVGRKKNTTEVIVLGADSEVSFPYRLGVSMDRCKFVVQEEAISMIIDTLDVITCRIDDTGLGMQLGENLTDKYPTIVSPATFTAPAKRDWAVEMKLKFQNTQIPIPLDKDLAYQIHSVRKKVSTSSTISFDAPKKEHHADKFWALGLALDGAINTEGVQSELGEFPI